MTPSNTSYISITKRQSLWTFMNLGHSQVRTQRNKSYKTCMTLYLIYNLMGKQVRNVWTSQVTFYNCKLGVKQTFYQGNFTWRFQARGINLKSSPSSSLLLHQFLGLMLNQFMITVFWYIVFLLSISVVLNRGAAKPFGAVKALGVSPISELDVYLLVNFC